MRKHKVQYICWVHFSPFAEIVSRCGEIQPDRLPRAKLCCFSAKSDRITSISWRSDGLRRSNRSIMKFHTFARRAFVRLPRSCRVAEKSDPICSREPNCAVFQQITTVQQAQLDAPMDSDAINSHAWSSIHLLKAIFSVCRDRIALRRNPIPIGSREPNCAVFQQIMNNFLNCPPCGLWIIQHAGLLDAIERNRTE